MQKALALSVLIAVGCSSSRPEATGSGAQPILKGQTDDARTNVVAIFREPAGASTAMFCTGALVGPNLVLTAQHCVVDLDGTGIVCEDTDAGPATRPGDTADASRFSVVTTTDAYDTTAKAYGVTRVITPPNAKTLPNCGNDVALLVLSEPIANATPIVPRLDAPPVKTETFTAVGYGYDGAVDTDGTRRSRTGLGIDSVGEVRVGGKLRATANDWVAVEGPCGGDSGSPALDADGKLIGVMSRGQPTVCKSMLYTRVDPFADWLKSAAVDAAKTGGYSAPPWAAPATIDGGSGTPTDSTSSCSIAPHTSARGPAAWLVIAAAVALALRKSRRRTCRTNVGRDDLRR